MITSTNMYTKKKKTQTDRTLGQMVKAKLYQQNHTETYTYTLTKREKGKQTNKKYIYI